MPDCHGHGHAPFPNLNPLALYASYPACSNYGWWRLLMRVSVLLSYGVCSYVRIEAYEAAGVPGEHPRRRDTAHGKKGATTHATVLFCCSWIIHQLCCIPPLTRFLFLCFDDVLCVR